MKLTEYTKKYAGATAKMWNESRDHFGGGDEMETAEERDKKEKKPWKHCDHACS